MADEEITQYEQCYEDWRHYDSNVWQLPSVTLAIASGLIAISYEYVKEPLPRTIILFLGFCLTFSLTIALMKHRLFMDQRTQVLEKYEAIWSKKNNNIRKIKRKTYDIKNRDKKWLQCTSAYKWLKSSMIIISLSLLALSIVSLITWVNTIISNPNGI